MDPRKKKQLIYGSIYILIIAGIISGIYFYKTRPTCFDAVQNGGEQGIDCGGKCAQVCRITVPLQTSVKVLKIGEGDYDILARVTNPNQEYGSGDVKFSIGDISSDFYILPGQTKYLILRSNSEVTETQLNIKNAEWEKLNLFNSQDVKFIVKNTLFKGSELEAIVFNDSDFDFDTVDVAVMLYDEQGNVVGVNSTVVNTLLSRTERYFKVIWPQPITGVSRTEVEVSTNLFKNSNFIKRYGTQEKFQEYYPN